MCEHTHTLRTHMHSCAHHAHDMQGLVLAVALNSKRNGLLALLIANNFVEIKGAVRSTRVFVPFRFVSSPAGPSGVVASCA